LQLVPCQSLLVPLPKVLALVAQQELVVVAMLAFLV
jgi:hypothetical protein